MNYKLLLAPFVLLTTVVNARAEVVVTVTELGGDTFFSAQGTLNLTALSGPGSAVASATAFVNPQDPSFSLGANPSVLEQIDLYSGITSAPLSFGSGSFRSTSLGTGDRFGFSVPVGSDEDLLIVPEGFTGGVISSTSTFSGQDFASLGIEPGTYVWSWGSGTNADSVTLNAVAVPEPSSLALIMTGSLAMGVIRRRKSVVRASAGT